MTRQRSRFALPASTLQAIERAEKACFFPLNTCPASRASQEFAIQLARQWPEVRLLERATALDVTENILAALTALYMARSQRDQLRTALSQLYLVSKGMEHPDQMQRPEETEVQRAIALAEQALLRLVI